MMQSELPDCSCNPGRKITHPGFVGRVRQHDQFIALLTIDSCGNIAGPLQAVADCLGHPAHAGIGGVASDNLPVLFEVIDCKCDQRQACMLAFGNRPVVIKNIPERLGIQEPGYRIIT